MAEENISNLSGHNVPLVRNVFHKRSRNCPLSSPESPEVNYKNLKLLNMYVSERGRMMPRRISSVSAKKQRELAREIKRARYLGLMPFVLKYN